MTGFLMAAAVAIGVIGTGCTDEAKSAEVLDNQGFTNVSFNGYSWFSCSQQDQFHTAFCADNPNGKRVCGVVCCGLLKACTVRW